MALLRPEAGPALTDAPVRLLGATDIRRLAEQVGVRPTKQRGQNFVIDANTVRRIVRVSGVGPTDVVVEIGPGLGSLTLALLEVARRVVAVEIDPALAGGLPATLADRAPGRDVEVVLADAMRVTELPGPAPTALVANLPYNVSVPVLLTWFEAFPSITSGLVMVQAEVAHRLAAAPGSKIYGVPSVKAAWYAQVELAGTVGRQVFWPAPNVDSALVAWRRRPPGTELGDERLRRTTFAVVDAAFAQRRKTLRAALAGLAGSPDVAEAALLAAGIDPRTRGEQLDVHDYVRLAAHLPGSARGGDVGPPSH
ncbi:dimethyladenosine transferase [Aeromicrobium marinum DSM 15272]|uniref:Ribosomal RNA small subunit methyltransferase A n=1 Tax=Aeromicrobium marinum DSM 15272 TaxID=585531 RepID=E2SBM1_9ACTN|nr:dimethyladenosine transferase [Aeromicrobium marinum DSM 15272]